jgi:hypothetical protein
VSFLNQLKSRAHALHGSPAAAIRTEVMDDLARLIVSEPNRFV